MRKIRHRKEKLFPVFTDGGTPCNSPWNYGIGYGSYKLGDSSKIRSISFGVPMSNNAAEIRTIAFALQACQNSHIEIFTDSRVAIKWANDCWNPKHKIKDNISDQMQVSIEILRKAAVGKYIKGTWKPRAQIFAIFGH